MLASCSSGLLLLLLSAIQSCHWSWLRPRVCFLFHMQHLVDEVVTEMLPPQRPKTTRDKDHSGLSMSNFCLSPLLFLPPHMTESTVLSLFPSLLPRSLHPSHSLSLHPPGLSAPLPFSNISSQCMHSTSHIQDMLHPPLPCPCCSGGWVLHVGGQSEAACLISWGSGEQKMRGKGGRDRLVC